MISQKQFKEILKQPLSILGTLLDNYLRFVRLGVRKHHPLNKSIHNLPYFAYISLRRNPKMKVVAHFKEDGEDLQKLVEQLLLEVVVIKRL